MGVWGKTWNRAVFFWGRGGSGFSPSAFPVWSPLLSVYSCSRAFPDLSRLLFEGLRSGRSRRRGASPSGQAGGGTGPGTRRAAPAHAGAALCRQCPCGVQWLCALRRAGPGPFCCPVNAQLWLSVAHRTLRPMGISVHESVANTTFDDMMSQPGGPEMLAAAQLGLWKKQWDEDYVNAIGQPWGRSTGFPPAQLAMFAMVHSLVHSGRIAMSRVATVGTPGRDRDREANAAALSRLPYPFTASVDMRQRGADHDGIVSWSAPVEVSLATGLIDYRADGSKRPYSLHFMIPPGEADLEVGASLPSRTWMHLVVESGKLARWPYGQSCLWLFVDLGHLTEDLPPWMTST